LSGRSIEQSVPSTIRDIPSNIPVRGQGSRHLQLEKEKEGKTTKKIDEKHILKKKGANRSINRKKEHTDHRGQFRPF
jgi:hypothetical protein